VVLLVSSSSTRGKLFFPGICFIWHSRNVAEQGEMPCLDNS